MPNRPEYSAPPELFYNVAEAKKYTYNSRIINIQEQMCERAIELLLLPENQSCLLLDIGCGSGLSGSVLERYGYHWIGIDISASMLEIAVERKVNGDLIRNDMGQGLPFKASTFDGVVSISALQWLCNIDNSSHFLQKRLRIFFSSLFSILSNGARAVFQFYPANDDQVNLITAAATKAGFFGGTIIDYPNSKKARKFFLVLMTSGCTNLPTPIHENRQLTRAIFNKKNESQRNRLLKCKKSFILKKKERCRKQGKKVKLDSKYSGRKRHNKF